MVVSFWLCIARLWYCVIIILAIRLHDWGGVALVSIWECAAVLWCCIDIIPTVCNSTAVLFRYHSGSNVQRDCCIDIILAVFNGTAVLY